MQTEAFPETFSLEDPYYATEAMATVNPAYVREVEKAVNDELHAIHFYAKMMELAPDASDRQRISAIRQDEIRHYHQFYRLYMQLTGRHPQLQPGKMPTDYQDGLKKALEDELEAVAFYQRVAAQSPDARSRQLFLNTAQDEQRHAMWLLFLIRTN